MVWTQSKDVDFKEVTVARVREPAHLVSVLLGVAPVCRVAGQLGQLAQAGDKGW